MLEPILDAIIDEFSTGKCLRDIANHWQCRCTVPGPGMRAAGNLLVQRYKENGVSEAEMIPYPADDRTGSLDGRTNPLEWRPHSASLSVLSPEGIADEICSFAEEPISLVCNSHPTPPEGIEAELVVPQGDIAEAMVEPGQWAGKIVMTNQFPSTVAVAVHKAGGIGIVSDCVCPPWLKQYPPEREPEDVPDLVMWTVFPGRRSDPPLFGFNLSPRQGRHLREFVARSDAPVRLRAVVDAELIEGSSDLVSAVIPGTDLEAEEVWVLAHLSEPGARDNASGCCLSLELARVLIELTGRGILPPLRRTVRFLHATEVAGFLPFIHEHRDRLPEVVAGACVDSIGQDFGICGGSMVLFLSPEHNASFVDGLVQHLLRTVSGLPAKRFSDSNYATYPWHAEPYFGNDAFISDGFFDIPAPQVSSWPDRFYHSNLDTTDQICPNVLGRSGTVFGTFLYLLATAGECEAIEFARLAAQDWKQRISMRLGEAAVAADRPKNLPAEIIHMGLQAQDAVSQVMRFAPQSSQLQAEVATITSELAEFASREGVAAARIVDSDPGSCLAEPAVGDERFGAVPQRFRWGVPTAQLLGTDLSEKLGTLCSSQGVDFRRVWPWINGRRTIGEIAERLRFGGKVTPDALLACLDLLEQASVIALG